MIWYLYSKLDSLLCQGLSEPEFYYWIIGSNNFSVRFIKIISHYEKIGYNINVLHQTACLVVNHDWVDHQACSL